MDGDKYYDKLLRPALIVNEIPENFDPKSTPQTGEEYLLHVRYEANRCEEWLKADISQEKLNKELYIVQEPSTCLEAPKEFLSNSQWQQKSVADFASFRIYLERIKNSKTDIQYAQYNPDLQFWEKKFQTEPKLSEFLTFSQRTLCKLLEFVLIWMDLIKEGESINHSLGVWLYAVLASLETPLLPDTCYSLREIARKCSEIRHKLDKNSPEDVRKSLNLFICIIALYFNNRDLVKTLE